MLLEFSCGALGPGRRGVEVKPAGRIVLMHKVHVEDGDHAKERFTGEPIVVHIVMEVL